MDNRYDATPIEKIVSEFINIFKQNLNNAKGQTRVSEKISHRVNISDNVFEITISLPGYYRFIEDGVNGYQNNQGSPYSFKNNGKNIPVQPLIEWIQVKHITLPHIRGINIEKYAYMLSRSIKKKGIKKTPVLSETVKEFDLKNKIINNIKEQIYKNIIKSLYEGKD